MPTTPFKIHVPDENIERLRQKLALSDFPHDEPSDSESSWTQGPPVAEIKRLASVWQTSFNWRKVESHFNTTLPQFVTPVEVEGFGTYNIHHVHKTSTQPNAIPLLFLHGWPGSFIEVTKILDDLVQGADDDIAFHVVAPSLIDFGFTSSSGKKGFLIEHHAETYHKLMLDLGYEQYVIQAGDVGSLVTRFIAMKYGNSHCKAYHTNTSFPPEPKPDTHPEIYAKFVSAPLTDAETKGLQRSATFYQEGFGYYKQQSTKPLTIGYALRDSPVALLAWLYEKLHDWSDNYPWTDEEILTWVSIYYFSTAGPEAASSVYFAMEHPQPPALVASQVYINVPFGAASFSNDSILFPKVWNQSLGPLVFESEYETGGHFAAWERPDAIVKDLRSMFKGAIATYGFNNTEHRV